MCSRSLLHMQVCTSTELSATEDVDILMRAESTSNTQVVSLIPSAMISYIHPRCQCSLLVPVALAIGLAQRSTFCAFVNLRPDKLRDPALC